MLPVPARPSRSDSPACTMQTCIDEKLRMTTCVVRHVAETSSMRDKPRQGHAQIDIQHQRTLRTAESTNLHATHIAFSSIDRLPRACGACTTLIVSLEL